MGLLQELRLAAGLDRLSEGLGLKPPPPDPIMEVSRQLQQGVFEQFARAAAEERFRTRQWAEMRERQQPGYIAQLNRQRQTLGLPPI